MAVYVDSAEKTAFLRYYNNINITIIINILIILLLS